MVEVVEVECRNRECPGRTEVHSSRCRCQGTGEVPAPGPVQVDELIEDRGGVMVVGRVAAMPCTEEPLEVDVERWQATWHPAGMFLRGGHWEGDIHCPACTEEGVPVDE